MKFSSSTGGFYDPNFNWNIPSDAIDIPDELYVAIKNGQAAGKEVHVVGGLPALTDTVDHVPPSITPRQGLIMLSRLGILSQVQAAIDAMEGQAGDEARIDFDHAREWLRDWTLLNDIATGLGLSTADIDQLFIQSSTI